MRRKGGWRVGGTNPRSDLHSPPHTSANDLSGERLPRFPHNPMGRPKPATGGAEGLPRASSAPIARREREEGGVGDRFFVGFDNKMAQGGRGRSSRDRWPRPFPLRRGARRGGSGSSSGAGGAGRRIRA
ncbi:Hypothetical predicted protein [Podarcis lilfordi]|uniref:Uncharacterized protein n=1 Tax=Podarcis lilfordi TaxID=74358 RepID=A0AA35JR82_9SAUR|nr:Hypothetical predicted protein [Podarcis lilfordi]